MFRTIATGLYPRFLQKRFGALPLSPVDTMLVTTGVALTVRREKVALGLSLLALGGYRAWRVTRGSARD